MISMILCASVWATAHSDLKQLLTKQAPSSWKQHLTISSEGKTAKQEILFYGRRSDDLLYTRMEILAPDKWTGIRIAQIDAPDQADPYWIYLPALKKVNAVKCVPVFITIQCITCKTRAQYRGERASHVWWCFPFQVRNLNRSRCWFCAALALLYASLLDASPASVHSAVKARPRNKLPYTSSLCFTILGTAKYKNGYG